MGLFGGTARKSYLGVDIGTGGIKVVELFNDKGRSRLMTYGYSEKQFDEAGTSPFDNPRETGEILAKVCKEAGTSSTAALAALPISNVFSTIISVPPNKDKNLLKQSINNQVRKLTPMPLEEMITYSTFIDEIGKKPEEKQEEKGKKKKEEKKPEPAKPEVPRYAATEGKAKENIRVLVTGSAKSLVQKYIEIFKVAKLQLQALDTEAFAVIRSLVGRDKSSILILDMGHMRSNLTVVEKGIPFLTRSVNIGGETVTKKLVEQMGLPLEQAVQMKMDLGTLAEGGAIATGGMPAILESVMQPIVNEIKFAIEQYAKMDVTKQTDVEKIIISGGSAHLPHLDGFLSATLNKNVYVGDPWARVVFPEELRPVLDEIGPRMAVGIGLAMREMES